MTIQLPCPERFMLEPGIVYMDNASVAPIPRAVEQAGLQGVSSKTRPWLRDREAAQAQVPLLRARAAALIGAQTTDMAITCAASYGLATARANLPLRAGERILVLQDDHTSQMLTWRAHAEASGAALDVVARPADGHWTHAILSHLANGDSRPIALASLCETFWIDGSRIDLPVVCEALRAAGARIVLDLTQSAGVLDTDVRALRADFAVFPMYKWLLGPYSLALLYVAPRWQGGRPLEQNSFNRDADGGYSAGAARFDMGERDSFVGVPAALAALTMGAEWPRDALRRHLSDVTTCIADRLSAQGIRCLPAAHRSPHILGVPGLPDGVSARCRARGLFLTQRHGTVRIAPHAFSTVQDAERCAEVLIEAIRAAR